MLGTTFLVQSLGQLMVDIFVSAFGSFGGPLLGVYVMAMFIPKTNEKVHILKTVFKNS